MPDLDDLKPDDVPFHDEDEQPDDIPLPDPAAEAESDQGEDDGAPVDDDVDTAGRLDPAQPDV